MRPGAGTVLALLCLGALAIVAAGCGGGGETVTVIETAPAGAAAGEGTGSDDDATPDGEAPAGEGAPADEAPTEVLELTSFQSPSGNIACVLGADAVRCDIADREWSAPRPAGCPQQSDFGQGLEVSEDGGPGKVVCAGDTAMNSAATKLPYGSAARAGDFTCTSEEAGISCRDDGDNRGFFISKQSYELF